MVYYGTFVSLVYSLFDMIYRRDTLIKDVCKVANRLDSLESRVQILEAYMSQL